MRRFVLKDICQCDTTQQMRALEIRNGEAIRACMFNDQEISVNEHLRHIEGLRTSEDRKLYLLLKDGSEAAGAASLTAIDLRNKRATWGFYLDEAARGGVGHMLGQAVITHAFETLGLAKLNAEVLEGNPGSLA
ncbi:MAG: GNAT family N-acetyltransferase, partial [Pseudomonadota bacterium]